MYQVLQFRRQFLLTSVEFTSLNGWKCLKIDKYYLYSHPDVEINYMNDKMKSIAVIGNIFDSMHPQKGNKEILQDIMIYSCNIESLVLYMKRYAGRYALLYKDNKDEIILPDALALREIYYCTKRNHIVCGSQPNLIVKFANPEIKQRSDKDFLEYYGRYSKDSRWNPLYKWIGDETFFESVRHVLPNHYLDIDRREVRRYWPNQPIKRLELSEAVSNSCEFLQGNIRAMANRHPVMMAVTAGTDTRTLLAASKDLHEKIYYFINDQSIKYRQDILVPKKMFGRIGIPFHVHEVSGLVDDQFRKVFLNNTFFASERILPTIYNVYFKNHCDKVNILGIGEIGRTRFLKEPKNLNGYRIAYKLGYRGGTYVIKQAKKVLADVLPTYRKYGINVMTGIYWEQMLGNWGATGNSESDIAIEEVNPMNSHELYEIFLGIDDKYTKYKNNILFREMIRRMWPELLEFPINPGYTLRDKFVQFLLKIRLFGLIKELKYQLNYFSYLFSRSRDLDKKEHYEQINEREAL